MVLGFATGVRFFIEATGFLAGGLSRVCFLYVVLEVLTLIPDSSDELGAR